jgi:predicted signal transduction protein with EAL and GGDEF domain
MRLAIDRQQQLRELCAAYSGIELVAYQFGIATFAGDRRIVVQDFGSEYSSFDYVRAYGVNHLKVAQSFINRSTTDPESAATIRAIVNFARDIGIVVIAQGVETEQQRDLLTLTDITTQAQGFHFSKPVGAKRASELLRKGSVALADESSTKEQLRPEPRGAFSAHS